MARREAIGVETWARWAAGVLGLIGLGAGGTAVFVTDLEAGPVALIVVGALLLFIGLAGVMPTRLKIGDNEAEWLREIGESVERIEEKAPELSAILDSGGASLENILSGRAVEAEPTLAQAGAKVGSLVEEVRFVSARAGQDRVPPEALLEIARWYLTKQDWSEAARYLDAYVRRVDADWEVYFSLGVANANRRQGATSDLAALRAYDEALRLMPTDGPTRLTARLYSHRSGIKKRLGRLAEAKADAELAKRLAEQRYDQIDATYNLACIEAMSGNREAALRQIGELKQLGGTDHVLGHLNDYFSSIADDPEFRSLVGLDPR